ncbi:DnaJ domain protein (macronuclear) [Tetrahymena thermophila SB210]|uniref:DnaJ domain protein n=1 Tax=Tetrahymena thermophila (strain SB210) TaxID=312017 RepID=I7MES7_TETTS|nr:DnaJ domain protein [Tetrahymena thermophila SB210]EAR97518.2 DnaJ domain protein [Tetrahymena thermophila SB210]|eukprot:XP_001017763.2 DnaJ domain protein [Tetrahymena thermophila SB210]
MFHIARNFLKFKKYSQLSLLQNEGYLQKLMQIKQGCGYPLLKNSHIHFFYSTAKMKDYYKILDVPENATQDQIKKQFYKLAKLYHPDSGDSKGDDEKFKEISEAYNIVGDEGKRIKYDSDRNLYKQQQEQNKRQYNQYQSSQSNQYTYQQYQSFKDHQKRYHQQYQQQQQQQYEEYEPYNPYTRSKQQSAQDDQKYKTYKDYQGFQTRDFDRGNMVREGFFENMKDAPELWVLTGIMLLLVLRWFFLTTVEQKQKNYTGDEDFEYGQPRGRIVLSEEDIQGLTLVKLEELDATGKYLLPPKAKASVEEYRSIAKSIDYDIKKENQKKKKKASDLGVEDKFADDILEEEDFEAKLEKLHQERKQSILEQVIEKAEWEQAEKEKKEQQVKKAKPQTYRNASSQVMYEKSANPNLYSNFNYADRFQKKKTQEDKQSNEKKDKQLNTLNEQAQQALDTQIQEKAQLNQAQIDTIQQLNPDQFQVFGSKKKSKKQSENDQNIKLVQQESLISTESSQQQELSQNYQQETVNERIEQKQDIQIEQLIHQNESQNVISENLDQTQSVPQP